MGTVKTDRTKRTASTGGTEEPVAPAETMALMIIPAKRKVGRVEKEDLMAKYSGEVFIEADENQADLIISETQKKTHMPVIDIDRAPFRLVPSTTPGHQHLYIDQEITWSQYVVLLAALVDCGFVEYNYYDAALRRGYSAVRKPNVAKMKRRQNG